MLSKNEVKYIQSLGHKKQRSEAGVFIAEGPKMVSELFQLVPQQVEKIYALEAWAAQQDSLHNAPVQVVSPQELERISGLATPNQVLAVVKQFSSVTPRQFAIALYLDGIQDPGNFGTIIRIADWFGVQHVVCSEGCADMYNPKVVQATMASIARVNVYYDEQKSWLKQQQGAVLAATLEGEPLYNFRPVTQCVLVIGNESKGISSEAMACTTTSITIPKRGAAESLNAAVATGILLSHLTRG